MISVNLIGFIHGNIITLFEVILWNKRLWCEFFPLHATRKPENDAYHLFLAIAYFIPFIPLITVGLIGLIDFLYGGVFVWLLNDILWQFYAIRPRDWVKWIKYYFNPYDNSLLWYARLGIKMVKVTPRRMFYVTIARTIFLLICFLVRVFY